MHWIILKKRALRGRWEAHPFLYGNKKEAELIAARWEKEDKNLQCYVHPEPITLRDGSNQDVP